MTTSTALSQAPFGRLTLDGRAALVTGAAAGIGAACASLLAARGAHVTAADVDGQAASELAATLPHGAVGVTLDVRDPESVEAAVAEVVARTGRLDIAVNNAGVGVPVPYDVGSTSLDEWRRVTSVNLDGVMACLSAELRAMVAAGHGGSVVNMGSIGAASGIAGASSYVASKHAVLGLTRTVAVEYAERGVRCNLVVPGYVDTAISPRTPEQKERLASLLHWAGSPPRTRSPRSSHSLHPTRHPSSPAPPTRSTAAISLADGTTPAGERPAGVVRSGRQAD